MNMSKDWTKIYKKYKGMWVALADDEVTVLGAGKSLNEALNVAKNKGYSNPIFTHMPDKMISFVGGV